MDQPDREVRLGVVLYGGVSLAVYIGGVVQELFDAVHDRGVYKVLRRLIGSEIKVDIVSGTSAGGINGLLLAFALANRVDLEEVGRLWREKGDIEKLMRSVREDAPPSLLDGAGYFQGQLDAALAAMLASKKNPENPLKAVDAIDVFLTATDFYGQQGFVLDDLNDVIAVKDHRRVFQLKYRQGRATDDLTAPVDEAVREQWRKALASICRATASFPGAFEPVQVPQDERTGSERQMWHHWLHDWSASKSPHDFVLIDGGVLDNKPFTHTLKAIYARTADREVDRRLIFCEPDPENLAPPDSHVPNFAEVVIASLSTLPGYETISDDLQSLADHNARLASYKELVQKLPQGMLPARTPEYSEALYLRARILRYSELLVVDLLAARRSDGRARAEVAHKQLSAEEDRLRTLMKKLRDDASAEELAEFLDQFDVSLHQRWLFHITYKLYDLIYGPEASREAGAKNDLKKELGTLNKSLELLKILEWAEGEWRERFGKRELDAVTWRAYREGLDLLFSSVEPQDRGAKRLHEVMQGRLRKLEAPDRAPRGDGALLRLLEVPNAGGMELEEFKKLDALTYPIESLAQLAQKDPIETLRISPRDAQLGFCRRQAYDKVTGDTLGHFGAFIKRSWRSNDLMWGRLDATTLLIQALLRPGAVKRAALNVAELRGLVAQTFAGTALSAELKVLNDWLSELERDREAAAEKLTRGSAVHVALATLAQGQILQKVLGTVLYDAVKQGAEWGTVPAGGEGLDANVAAWSAAQVAALKVALDRQEAPPVPKLEVKEPVPIDFANDYRVGEETPMQDVPPLILLRIVAHAALVMERVLAPLISRSVPSGMVNALKPLFAVIRGVTVFLYAFTVTARTHPIRNALLVATFVMLLIGLIWRDELWLTPTFSALWLTVFVLAPLLYQGLCALLLLGRWRHALGAGLMAGGLALAALLFILGEYGWLSRLRRSIQVDLADASLASVLGPLAMVTFGFILGGLRWRTDKAKDK